MRPIDFNEANSTLLGGERKKYGTSRDVLDLPVYKDGQIIVSLWRPSLIERLSILFWGNIWLYVHSSKTHSPVSLLGKLTIFAKLPKEKPCRSQ